MPKQCLLKGLSNPLNSITVPTFTPRAGVEYIVRGASPGNFIIPRINKTTEGDYKCILYYHKKHSRKLEKESDDVDIDVDSLDFDHHEQGMKDHMDVHMTCVAHLKPNEHFVSLSVYKGSKVFYSYDDKYGILDLAFLSVLIFRLYKFEQRAQIHSG